MSLIFNKFNNLNIDNKRDFKKSPLKGKNNHRLSIDMKG